MKWLCYSFKNSHFPLFFKELAGKVPLTVNELKLKLKYVYKLIKWIYVTVNHFPDFKWFVTFIKSDYATLSKILIFL